MTSHRLQTIISAIEQARQDGLLLQTRDVSGFSGERMVGTLQRLARAQADLGAYLEVGVFQGLTLISVANALDGAPAYGVDNFAQFDPKGENKGLVEQRASANDLRNVSLINADYEDALESLAEHIGDQRISTYFVDGPHDYRSQLMCLLLMEPHLSERAVIVVDDCNYRHVRLANRDFLQARPEFKLLFEAYTPCHPGNMRGEMLAAARAGFWNGINVIVHDPDNELAPTYPPTLRTRMMYENDHRVHSAEHGYLGPEAVEVFAAIGRFSVLRAVRRAGKILVRMVRPDRQHKGRFESMNTFSEDLTDGRFADRRAPSDTARQVAGA